MIKIISIELTEEESNILNDGRKQADVTLKSWIRYCAVGMTMLLLDEKKKDRLLALMNEDIKEH